MADYHYDESHIPGLLPDRSDSDIPPQVQYFLSICETAVASERWSHEKSGTPQYKFVEGVLDHWWGDGMVEPYWEQLFVTDLSKNEEKFRRQPLPSVEQFAYHQGAIVGYLLREEYKHE